MTRQMDSIRRIWVVLSKEVQDNLRDRRSIASSMVSTLVGPLILMLMIVIIGRSFFQDNLKKPLEIPVIGADRAPTLITFLSQRGVVILDPPADPESAVLNGDTAVILEISSDYPEDFVNGRPATVRLMIDSSRQSSLTEIERLRNLLESYDRIIGSLRLTARGINPTIIEPLALEQVDLATPQTQVLIFLNMMPYFVILVIFVGGMHVVIDATAGEKERGSLEPLLINPVTRAEFVLGKLLSSIPFALLAVFFNLLAFAAAFNLIPLEDFVGFQLSINLLALVKIFVLSIPMVFLAAALQMVIATFTRSFKEAQTYVGFLPLIPALPGIGLAFLPVKPTLWIMLIPTFGQQILINQFMRSEPTKILNILVSSGITLLFAALLTLLAVRMYREEKIIFGSQ
jgi:sodium transport system permease protein